MVSFSGSQHAHTCREILVSGCLGAVSWGGFARVNIVGTADEFSFFVWSSQLELRLIKTYLHLAKNTSIPICFAITERYIYCSIGIAYSYIGFWQVSYVKQKYHSSCRPSASRWCKFFADQGKFYVKPVLQQGIRMYMGMWHKFVRKWTKFEIEWKTAYINKYIYIYVQNASSLPIVRLYK